METFAVALMEDPMYYIGLAFAFIGAIGFLIFLRGFLAGTPHLFTIRTDEHFLRLYRTRQIWGVFIMLAAFIVWEIVRAIAGFFS